MGDHWTYSLTEADLQRLQSAASTVVQVTATDAAGNVSTVSQLADSRQFAPPVVVERIPADGEGVANTLATGGAQLNLVFSEAVVKGAGAISLYLLDGTLVESLAVGSDQVSITGAGQNDVFIRPSAALVSGQAYYLKVDAGAFEDLDGNGFAGLTADGVAGWNFTAVDLAIQPEFVAADDIINASEAAGSLSISGVLNGSAAVVGALKPSDITITVTPPGGNPVVVVQAATLDPATGAFSASVAPGAWGNGVYSYTVSVTGSSGAASGQSASYHFDQLQVDLVGPTTTASLSRVQDDVGPVTGDLAPGAVTDLSLIHI